MGKEKVTVTGDSKHIDILIQENKIRISRGHLKFEKVTPKVTPKVKVPEAELSDIPKAK
jgi:hypothetical protein